MTTINQKDRLNELLNIRFDDLNIRYKFYYNIYKPHLSDIFNHEGTVIELINGMCLRKVSISDIEKVSDEYDNDITKKIIEILEDITCIMHDQNECFYCYDDKLYLVDELDTVIPKSLIKLSVLLSFKKVNEAFNDNILTPDKITIKHINKEIKNFIKDISSVLDKI